jgi:hypothetical protein
MGHVRHPRLGDQRTDEPTHEDQYPLDAGVDPTQPQGLRRVGDKQADQQPGGTPAPGGGEVADHLVAVALGDVQELAGGEALHARPAHPALDRDGEDDHADDQHGIEQREEDGAGHGCSM